MFSWWYIHRLYQKNMQSLQWTRPHVLGVVRVSPLAQTAQHHYLPAPKSRTSIYCLKDGLNALPQPWFMFLHVWSLHEPRVVLQECRDRRFGATEYGRALSSIVIFLGRLIERLGGGRVAEEADQAWWTMQVEALPAGYLLTTSPQRLVEVLGRLPEEALSAEVEKKLLRAFRDWKRNPQNPPDRV